MKYSRPKLIEALLEETRPVLATILETSGSAPQVSGASAVFSNRGLVSGTIGGGLLEARGEETARSCLEDGMSRLVTFRLDADPEDQEGAICGGEATILFDLQAGAGKEAFQNALEGFRSRTPGVMLTTVRPSHPGTVSVEREWLPARKFADDTEFRHDHLDKNTIADIFSSEKPGLEKTGDMTIFIEPLLALPHLVIAGAGHVGKAVAHLGSLLDFEVTVIDDRPDFANRENLPEADTIIVDDIGRAIRQVPPSSDNYFVIVTRGHARDADALRECVGRVAAYIGMIGSKNKVALMRREFLEKGWATPEEWERIHSPIGLEIRSETVEEIAVSIAAELVATRAGKREKDLL